jgi:hypothetical protein
MNMNFKSWLVGTTMLVMGTTGAFAEVVFNRGNSADPNRSAKTSTVYEAHILRDLFLGLTTEDASGSHPEGKLDCKRCKVYVRCAPERPGPMAACHRPGFCILRSALRSGNRREYAYMLAPVVNAEDADCRQEEAR